ncbi:MAG: hypothetical protein J6T81_08665 [Bacteroidales bacterium]|nr:hypothetical protein [Bacteroidales bacterium]
MKRIFLLLIVIAIKCVAYPQNYSGQYNNQTNNVIINNQPVIERVQYVEKYRTVYVDKPQPKRYARTLSEPVCLLGSIWVYVADLGDFKSQYDAKDILNRLNAVGSHGRNNWRIPSPSELAVMEQNADKIGLGDGIYMATSHKNGILRPVSTGASIEQQNAMRDYERQKSEEERRRLEAERQRINAEKNARRNAQQNIINTGQGISDGVGLIWATKNVGASSLYEKGNILVNYNPTQMWRLPSKQELQDFVKQATLTQQPYNGYLRKIYTHNGISIIGGRYLTKDGYYDVGTNDGLSGTQGYVRLVQDIE